jgi:transcriptional regulator GlxA family with amidase domain
MDRRTVGILIFDDVEVLDFAGPFEVFSRTRLQGGVDARRGEEGAPFQVLTVARSAAPVQAIGGLQVTPHHSFATVPRIDVLLVPGGFGTRRLLEDAEVLDWVRRTAAAAELVTSVCTGSLLLARVGLLEGKRATTHWAALDLLRQQLGVEVVSDQRWVDDGVITSAGVAAGIDMSFYVVEKLHGRAVADETARYIEYPRRAVDATAA